MSMNAESQIPEKVYKILQDLFNRTTQNGCTPAEAEEAATKAQEILMKYNLEMSDVQGRAKTGKRAFLRKHFDLEGVQGRHDSDWVACLVNVIAKHNFCRAICLKYGTMEKMAILGEQVNLEVVMYVIDQLIPRIESACSTAWKQYNGEEKRNTFRRGFLKGCVGGISYKLHLQKQQMEQQSNQVMALIRVSDSELIEFTSKEFPDLKAAGNKNKLRKSSESKQIGFEAGMNMQINKGLGNSNTPGQLE